MKKSLILGLCALLVCPFLANAQRNNAPVVLTDGLKDAYKDYFMIVSLSITAMSPIPIRWPSSRGSSTALPPRMP